MPSRLIAPAPASNQGHIPIPPKVPGHITVTIESSTTTPSIPVATISGQQVSALAVSFMLLSLSCWLLKIWAAFIVFQGHSSNLHHLMPANIQIIRGSAPALQIGTPAVPPQTFTSHLPRGMHLFIFLWLLLLFLNIYFTFLVLFSCLTLEYNMYKGYVQL